MPFCVVSQDAVRRIKACFGERARDVLVAMAAYHRGSSDVDALVQVRECDDEYSCICVYMCMCTRFDPPGQLARPTFMPCS